MFHYSICTDKIFESVTCFEAMEWKPNALPGITPLPLNESGFPPDKADTRIYPVPTCDFLSPAVYFTCRLSPFNAPIRDANWSQRSLPVRPRFSAQTIVLNPAFQVDRALHSRPIIWRCAGRCGRNEMLAGTPPGREQR